LEILFTTESKLEVSGQGDRVTTKYFIQNSKTFQEFSGQFFIFPELTATIFQDISRTNKKSWQKIQEFQGHKY